MKFSLRNKLIALTTTIVALVMGGVTWFSTFRDIHTRRDAADAAVGRIARSIATLQLLDRQDWSVYQNYISQLVALNADMVYVAVYDDHQSLRAHAVNRRLIDVPGDSAPGALSGRAEADLVRRLDQGAVAEASRADLLTHRVNIQLGDRVLGSVHVGFSLIDLNDEVARAVRQSLLLGCVFVLAAAGIAFLLARRLTRPLEHLNTAMQALAGGDLEQRVAIRTHDEIAELSRRFNDMVENLRERQIIERLGHELGGTFQFERLASLVRDRLAVAVGAAEARLFVHGRDRSSVFHAIRSPEVDGGAVSVPLLLPNGTADLVRSGTAEAGEGLMLAQAPPDLAPALLGAGLTSRDLILPMLVQGDLFGVLALRLAEGKLDFDPKQRQFAGMLAQQAALALENALLYDELREQERMKSELDIARTVQRRLLPAVMPRTAGFDIDAFCEPASEVGGDYYDFFDIGAGRTGVAIADVAGKGTKAAFYMAEIKGMTLALASVIPSPRDLVSVLNRRLHGSVEPHVFASMIYGVLDAGAGTFTFARAGHLAPLHLHTSGTSSEVVSVRSAGMALALESGTMFERVTEERVLQFVPGDLLLLFTDGITEAMNGRGELFGEQRLIQLLEKGQGKSAQHIRASILAAVAEFAAGTPRHDDVTLVVIRALPRGPTGAIQGTPGRPSS